MIQNKSAESLITFSFFFFLNLDCFIRQNYLTLYFVILYQPKLVGSAQTIYNDSFSIFWFRFRSRAISDKLIDLETSNFVSKII